jgi:hypothetical protein
MYSLVGQIRRMQHFVGLMQKRALLSDYSFLGQASEDKTHVVDRDFVIDQNTIFRMLS